ncbi:MAG: hypothetical protein EHM87_21705 [Burkholderiales bacterium]|nr:MAG: hypothetical protein EHM87_21705 [Burkholderiales bacterium]
MFEAHMLFGGGWTPAAAVKVGGWRAQQVPNKKNLWVIGRRGKPGAVTVLVKEGKIDIAFYSEDGPSLWRQFREAGNPGEFYPYTFDLRDTPTYSGWFLEYLNENGDLRDLCL